MIELYRLSVLMDKPQWAGTVTRLHSFCAVAVAAVWSSAWLAAQRLSLAYLPALSPPYPSWSTDRCCRPKHFHHYGTLNPPFAFYRTKVTGL